MSLATIRSKDVLTNASAGIYWMTGGEANA